MPKMWLVFKNGEYIMTPKANLKEWIKENNWTILPHITFEALYQNLSRKIKEKSHLKASKKC